MLQVARVSSKALADATELVAAFLTSQHDPQSGGFLDRAGAPDLYYTIFGIEGFRALQLELPTDALCRYLEGFGDGEGLDLIHLGALARCWAGLPRARLDPARRRAIAARFAAWRSDDGGYGPTRGEPRGTVYATFIAYGALQDLDAPLPPREELLACLRGNRAADGGYANMPGLPAGLTPPTAAAVTLLRALGEAPDPELNLWLLDRALPEGGFFATPDAPIPDLLSTATALHALAGLKADLAPLAEPNLDFIDSLWTNRGGFFGHWEDDVIDCEYTYYALLALGHLSLA